MNAVERITEYIYKGGEEAKWENPKAPTEWPNDGKFVVQNISYKYRPNLPFVINNISFKFDKH